MEEVKHKPSKPIGPKIAKVRNLRGMSQEELGKKLGGISKSAVSRLEQNETLEDELLTKVCSALDVTEEGLKNLDEDLALYLTANFYDNCNINASAGNSSYGTFIFNSIEEISKIYEKQLQEIKAELKREMKNKDK